MEFVTWEELVKEFRELPMEDMKEKIGKEAITFSPMVSPDIDELMSRLKKLECYLERKKEFSTRQVLEKVVRIIVEPAKCDGALPLVYFGRKHGKLLGEYAEILPAILCSTVEVYDEALCKDKKKLLILLLFYMEYPIRTSRLAREGLLQTLLYYLKTKNTGKTG